MKNLTLITGATRSGKSAFAENIANQKALDTYYLATMPMIQGDKEQSERIARHQARRPKSWKTIESALNVCQDLQKIPPGKACVILDCLSLFVTNIMLENCSADTEEDPYIKESAIQEAVAFLLTTIERRSDLEVLIVTNEVGWGVVPPTSLGRAFRDFLGQSNQQVANAADQVFLCCVGQSIQLKPSKT